MVIARAPVRISFGGGGTDLEAYYATHGGLVVSAAITRYSYAIVREPGDGSIRLNSADYRLWERHAPGALPPVAEPLSHAKAALEAFREGVLARGVDLFTTAEVPPGTGLGSSSAMAVALVHALGAYTGQSLAPAQAAALACTLEIERLGMPIGRQDQYASAFGGLNTIEFAAEGVTVRPLPLPPEGVAALSARLLLFATGTSRHSGTILREQAARSGGNGGAVASLHQLKALAGEMVAALGAGDLDGFGHLLHAGWETKKRLSSGVSNPTIDAAYAAARGAGALGGKIAGAGGGGFMLVYAPIEAQPAVRQAMQGLGLAELSFDIDMTGPQVSGGLDQSVAGAVALP